MESEREEDSFTQGMDELNNFADRIFREDLRAIRQKDLIDKQVQATMNAQIANLQQAQMQLVQQQAQIARQAHEQTSKIEELNQLKA